jgi:DNA-binding XRE family transcriptional regulator
MHGKHENFAYFFSNNVKTIRENLGMTQKVFAEVMGIDKKTIGSIEEGRATNLEKVYLISRKFDYSMDDLLTKILP